MSDTPNNIVKLLQALIGPGQTVEDMLQQLYSERRIDTAIGAQLDILGRLVGQLRNGMDDDDYRPMIRARISVNRSKGTIEDVLAVADLVVNDVLAEYVVDNQGIAALVLRVEGVPVTEAVRDMLILLERDTVSGGVRLVLEQSQEPVANWLQLDTDNLDDELMLGAVD